MTANTTESIWLKQINRPKRLLVSLAHPDDESFGTPPAGTIVHYAQAGIEIHYICGTRGEAGSVDPEHLVGYDSIAALRTQELLCAAQQLGFAGVHFLNYHDSGMENSPANQNPACLIQAPVEVVAGQITALIRQLKPQVVLTFDPSGGYFHPDHIHMHKATSLAFHAAGDPAQFPDQLASGLPLYQPQKLYYPVLPRGAIKLLVKILPLFGKNPATLGRNRDMNLKRMAAVSQQVTTKINVAPYFKQTRQAAACHASQQAGLPKMVPNFVLKQAMKRERFSRVVPPPAPDQPIETDLFEGVVE